MQKTTETTKDNYIPYGEEWEKEMMKLPKKFLIGMLKKALPCIHKTDVSVKPPHDTDFIVYPVKRCTDPNCRYCKGKGEFKTSNEGTWTGYESIYECYGTTFAFARNEKIDLND